MAVIGIYRRKEHDMKSKRRNEKYINDKIIEEKLVMGEELDQNICIRDND